MSKPRTTQSANRVSDGEQASARLGHACGGAVEPTEQSPPSTEDGDRKSSASRSPIDHGGGEKRRLATATARKFRRRDRRFRLRVGAKRMPY